MIGNGKELGITGDGFEDGLEDGLEDGHWDGLEVCYEDSYAAGMVVGKDESYEGIEYNEDRLIEDWYDADSYLKGYAAGYDIDVYAYAILDKKDFIIEETQINQREPSEEEEDSFPFIAGVIGVVGIIAISVIYDYFRLRKGKKKQG